MSLKKHIPNFITLLNLLAGCMSILYFSEGKISEAAYAIFAAAVFDFFDGFSARMLKAYSKIGGELDSLADVVSFGVAPGFIIYYMIMHSHGRQPFYLGTIDILPLAAFLVPMFAALRLAKFNVDTRQSSSFLGLPTPAAGLMIASLPLIKAQLYEGQSLFYMVVTNTYFYLACVFLLSLLMVLELPLFALKFKSYAFKGNEIRYIFVAGSLLLLIFFQFVAIPFIVALYIFLSLVVFLADLS